MPHALPAGTEKYVRAAAWSALCLTVAFSFWGTIGKPDCQDMDFGAYYRAGAAVARGETPYKVDEHGPLGVYSYAPVYAYLFMPFTCLDYLWACRLWMVVNWTATAAGCLLALRLARGREQQTEIPWPALAMTLVAVGGYLWANIRMGQTGMLMVLGCLGWAWSARQGRRFTGGLLLAAACAVKLAPGVLVPYLVIRRDLRGLAGVLAGLVVLFLLPAAWVGWDGTVRLHREWAANTTATQIPAQACRRGNQSLLGQLARLPAISTGDVCIAPENLAALARIYPLVVLAAGSVLYGWIMWRRRGVSSTGLAGESTVLALLLIFMTLAHPRAWRCNFAALLLPCLLLAERWRRGLPGGRAGLAALGLVVLACSWPTRDVGMEGWTPLAWLLLGKHFWAALAVGAACVWSARPAGSRVAKELRLTNRYFPPSPQMRTFPYFS